MSSGVGASSLDDDDRFVQRNFAGGRDKRSRVTYRLHVHDDAVSARVIAQIVDEVTPADVQHRTYRHKGAEADRLLLTPIQNCRAQCAALAEERNISWTGNIRSK